MTAGVAVVDPAATYVDATVTVGRDTVLHPGVRLAGRTAIGERCVIGTGCQLTDTALGDGVTLRPYCVLDGSRVEADATLGPFARLRPGTLVERGADIGNFIEIKQATIGRGVKAHHVGYIGDATVGEGANIGAGVDHVQLRRGAEASDPDRSARLRRDERESRRPAHDRGRRVRGRRLRDHQGRAPGGPGRGTRPAARQGGLDPAAPGEPDPCRRRPPRPDVAGGSCAGAGPPGQRAGRRQGCAGETVPPAGHPVGGAGGPSRPAKSQAGEAWHASCSPPTRAGT